MKISEKYLSADFVYCCMVLFRFWLALYDLVSCLVERRSLPLLSSDLICSAAIRSMGRTVTSMLAVATDNRRDPKLLYKLHQ